jgi:hypothetical protein
MIRICRPSTSKPGTSDIQYKLTPDILVDEFEDVVFPLRDSKVEDVVPIVFRAALGRCSLAIQLNLVAVRVADINRQSIVLLHRLLGKAVRD